MRSKRNPVTRNVKDNTEFVTDDAKNGLITGVGIILGFSLTFFGGWATTPADWEWRDLIPICLFVPGVVVLSVALYRSLLPYKQTILHYEKTVQVLMGGIILEILAFLATFFV